MTLHPYNNLSDEVQIAYLNQQDTDLARRAKGL